MSNLNGNLSGKGALVDTNNDGVVDGFAHTIKNAGNFNTFSLTNGVLTIQGPTGGSSIGGSDTHVQFNDGGALNGESTMTYNKTSNTLTVSNLTVSDTLTVTTTTTLNSNTVTIGDSIIVLNSDATGSASANAGIEIERGDDTNVQLLWDETNDQWDFDGFALGSVGKVYGAGSGAVYTFTSDTDTGVEHTGADQLGLLTGGTRVLMVNANGVNIAPAGASGASSNQALLVDDVTVDTQTIGTSGSNKNLILAPHGSGSVELGGVNSNATSVTTTASAHNVVGTSVTIGAGSTTAGTTNNIAGGSLTLAAGQGKGSADGGSILFKTGDGAASGSSLNALTTKMIILDSGFVGISQNTPTVPLHVGGDVIISGNLTVSGSSTTVSTTNTFVSDALMTLNSGETGNGVTGGIAGIEIDRGENSGNDNPIARFIFDESDDEFKAQIETGSDTGSYTATTLKVGVLKTTGISDDDANTMVQVEESADENKIRFDTAGSERMIITDAGNVGIGTSAPGSLLEVRGPTGTGTASAGVLTLSTAETSVGDGDQLGRIDFQAPLEADGSDAILVGASIYAEADANFTNTVNATELVFATGASEVAAEKMRLTSDGKVGIGTATPSEMLHLVSSAAASPTIMIENTGTEAAEAELIFQRTGTAAASQDIGHIKWKALDDGGATHTYGSVFVDAQDESAGTEDGRFIFMVAKGGTDNVEVLRLSGSEGFVWNDQSKDVDFRVESNGNTHMIHVDAGNDKVGIGGTPTAEFHTFSAGSGDNVIIETTVANSTTSAPNLVLYRNGATAEDNDLIGQIVFRGKNDAGTPQDVNYVTIEAGLDDVTDGSEDGHMTINLIENGTLTEFMRIRAATRDVVVNDQGDDIDFRCEGSSDANLLFVDADTDKVGIGLDAPKTKLTVEGTVTLKEQANAEADTAAYGQLWVKTATPNQLYFTTDAGDDIQLTSGTSIAGGGGGTVDVVSNVATSRILGRTTAGSGDSEELTAASVRTLLNVADGATAYADANAISAIQTAATLELAANATFTAKRSVVEAITANGIAVSGTALDLMEDQRGKVLTTTVAGAAGVNTIGLPNPAASQIGDTYVVLNTHSGAFTIDRAGGAHGTAQNLNGAASNGSLPANEAVTLVYIDTNAWWGIGL